MGQPESDLCFSLLSLVFYFLFFFNVISLRYLCVCVCNQHKVKVTDFFASESCVIPAFVVIAKKSPF